MRLLFIVCLSLLCASVFAQKSDSTSDYNAEIQFYLNKSKKLKTAGWITLGGGYLATGIALAAAPTGQAQDNVLVGTSLIPIATYILLFKSSDNKNIGKKLEIERDLALATTEHDRQIIIDEAARYFKNKAVANRIPAIILSSIGGIAIGAVLATPSGTEDIFRIVPIVGGITYIGASVPFYVKAAKHTKASKEIKEGKMPQHTFREVTPVVSVNDQFMSLGFRIGL